MSTVQGGRSWRESDGMATSGERLTAQSLPLLSMAKSTRGLASSVGHMTESHHHVKFVSPDEEDQAEKEREQSAMSVFHLERVAYYILMVGIAFVISVRSLYFPLLFLRIKITFNSF